ncbi:MAG: radical SAM protein [Sedimenticola sp.]
MQLISQGDGAGALRQTFLLDQSVTKRLKINTSEIIIEKRKITYNFDMYDPYEVKKFIENGSPIEDIIIDILLTKSVTTQNIFGISVAVEDQTIPALVTIKVLKSIAPTAKIVLGGNILTRIYNELIAANLLEGVDIIVTHEGEDAWKCISNADIDKLNDCCKKNTINLRSTTPSPLVSEPYSSSEYFPPRVNFPIHELSEYHALHGCLPIITSKRCYWSKCDFCAIYAGWGNKHKRRKISEVISEIKHHTSNGIKYFRIVDEDLHPNAFIDLVDKLSDSGIDARFEAYSRFEKKLLTNDFYDRAYKAGFRQLFFGLESSCKNETDKWNKTNSAYDLDIINDTLEASSKAGILNYVFILIGLPGSSISAEKDTIEYVIHNKNIHCATVGSFVVDKLSPIHKNQNIQDKYNIRTTVDTRITTEVDYRNNNTSTKASAKDRAKKYIGNLFQRRPDLAVSSGLSEENRMILSDIFGNSFLLDHATGLLNSQDPNLSSIVHDTKRRIVREKIDK